MKQDARQKNGDRKIFHFLSPFCPSMTLRSLRLAPYSYMILSCHDSVFLRSCSAALHSLREFSLSCWQSFVSLASFLGSLPPSPRFQLASISVDQRFNSLRSLRLNPWFLPFLELPVPSVFSCYKSVSIHVHRWLTPFVLFVSFRKLELAPVRVDQRFSRVFRPRLTRKTGLCSDPVFY
jgi:hypothetical protein